MNEIPFLRPPSLGRWKRSRLARRSRSRGLRRLLALLWVAGALASASTCGRPAPSSPASKSRFQGHLPAGESRTGALVSGTKDIYRLEVGSDEALRLEVVQTELDLEMFLSSPAGAELLRWDSPFSQLGPERFCIVVEKAGEYQLVISPFGAVSGGYSVHRFPSRRATGSDRLCEAGALRFMAAEALRVGEAKREDLVEAYDQARSLWRRAGEDFLEGQALRELGMTTRSLGRLEEAWEHFETAQLKFLAAGQEPLAAESLNLLGLTALDLGRMRDADGNFSKALALARKAGHGVTEAMALNNQGLVAERLGQIHRAADLYRQALSRWNQGGDRGDRARTLGNLGRIHRALGYDRAARDFLAEALDTARTLGLSDLVADCLMELGWMELQEGRGDLATEALSEALGLVESAASPDPAALAGVLDRLGTAHQSQGMPKRARELYRRSLEISEAHRLLPRQLSTWVNLGLLEEEQGRWAEAQEWGEMARDLAASTGSRDHLFVVQALLARILREQGFQARAHETAEAALASLEEFRREALNSGGAPPAQTLWVDTAEMTIDVLVELHRQTEDPTQLARAFEISDLARARSFVDQIVEASVDPLRSPSPEQVEEEHRLLERIRGAAQGGESAHLEALDLELTLLRGRHRSGNPQFSRVLEAEPQTVAALQALLDPSTVLLSFEMAEPRSRVFRLTRQDLQVFEAPAGHVVESLGRMVFETLRQRDLRGQEAQSELVATELSRALLAASLEGVEAGHLLLIGDGWLYSLPWAALPDPKSGLPLLERFSVSTLPSASLLSPLLARAAERPRALGELAVVADPVFSRQDPRVEGTAACPARAAEDPSLPPLPFSALESRGALAAVDLGLEAVAHLGFNARRELLLKGELSDYRILHLATHAVIDEEEPQRSALHFSAVNSAGCGQASRVLLRDLSFVSLRADLVVLSACSSGRGKLRRGDGVTGFARSFFNAGATELLVTLWPVDDEATAQLMTFFYEAHLGEGLMASEALRRAQQRLRRDPRWRRPYFWAGFQLQGAEVSR